MDLSVLSESHTNYWLVTLKGDIDTKTAPSLLDALTKIDLSILSELRIDMAAVGFLSSAGLRAFVFAKQKMPFESRLILIGTNEEIADVINKTGLTQAITLVADHESIQ